MKELRAAVALMDKDTKVTMIAKQLEQTYEALRELEGDIKTAHEFLDIVTRNIEKYL